MQMTLRSSGLFLEMTGVVTVAWSILSGPVLVLATSFVSSALVFIGEFIEVQGIAVLCVYLLK